MNRTRFGMIETFPRADGFRVCILSPLAAGVGLTVTAANHVIHLERHWNPAKEAQATDRVYRIGQTRDVLVHVPILLHPERASYDVNLDKLLRSKLRWQDALTITAPEVVTTDEVFKGIFGGPEGAPPHGTGRPLGVDDVAGLSWELFEALVVELRGARASRVLVEASRLNELPCRVARDASIIRSGTRPLWTGSTSSMAVNSTMWPKPSAKLGMP